MNNINNMLSQRACVKIFQQPAVAEHSGSPVAWGVLLLFLPYSLCTANESGLYHGKLLPMHPQEGIPVGGRGVLYYSASASPLPQNATPQLRLGVNRWETLRTLDMQRAQRIDLPGADWWSAELEFDQVSLAAIRWRDCADGDQSCE